jgi:catalase
MDKTFAASQTSQGVQAPGSRQHATPAQMIDAFNAIFGTQRPGVRANHAKGVDLEGEFRPSASAPSVSKAPHLQKASVPITVRFSNFGGNPAVPDGDGRASPRGMSIRFRLPDGSDTDIVAHSHNGFPVATAEELREFLLALAASGPGVAKPTPFDDFLGAHPITKTFLESQIPPPVSYGTVSYYGVNTFKFTNAKGAVTFGRYQIRPLDGDQSLPKAEVAKADPDYLAKEIRQRVGCGPVRFTLVLEIAEPGDKLDDPSIAWPSTRRKVELGTIEITQALIDNAAAERQLVFNPAGLPPGIEAEDPMIQARSDAYLVSYKRRTASE